jgi:hypothetical protein
VNRAARRAAAKAASARVKPNAVAMAALEALRGSPYVATAAPSPTLLPPDWAKRWEDEGRRLWEAGWPMAEIADQVADGQGKALLAAIASHLPSGGGNRYPQPAVVMASEESAAWFRAALAKHGPDGVGRAI